MPRHVLFPAAAGRVLLLVGLMALMVVQPPAVSATGDAATRDVVLDCHVYHDAGQVWLLLSNWGMFGSFPGTSHPCASAPSARWPGADGDDYLWTAGLWVGAVAQGERLVSTAQYDVEFLPTEAPEDTLYPTGMGLPGGNRYPVQPADDDGDGLEDEDPRNGRDDDGDGLVDEDFGGIADQAFRCEYRDDDPRLADMSPDHTPLHLAVVQRTFQWSDPGFDSFVGIDYTIRNTGPSALDDVYVGFFADCDVPAGMFVGANDDRAGSYQGPATAGDGTVVPVSVAYMFDGASNPAPGYIGLVFLDHTTDPTGTTAPTEAALTSLQIFDGQIPFGSGGDPTSDAERYAAMAEGTWDPNTAEGRVGDYRLLIASGPFPTLAPGAAITYRLALVVGEGLQGLLEQAADAVRVYQGAHFDRDGDPSNGREYQVHWLAPADVPVPALTGALSVLADVPVVRLALQAGVPDAARLSVVRSATGDLPERCWLAGDFRAVRHDGAGIRAEVRDDDPGSGARTYTLRYAPDEGRPAVLARLAVTPHTPSALALRVRPNPANPRVVVSYTLPAPADVWLSVYDLRGRLVRRLLAGERPAGDGTVTWDGTDAGGRAAPSGTYRVVLRAGDRVVRRTVTLVR